MSESVELVNIATNPLDGSSMDVTFNEKWKLVLNKLGRTKHVIDCSTIIGQREAYRRCDIVRSVISEISNAEANLNIWAVDDNNKEITSLRAKKILNKLKQPNPYQSQVAFMQVLTLFRKIHGRCYVRKFRNSLGEYDYYIIPNHYLTIEWDDKYDLAYNRKVKKYIVSRGFKREELTSDEVFVFYDGNISTSSCDETVLGDSRLVSLSEIVSAYVVMFETLTGLYSEGGARNIIGMGAKDVYLQRSMETEKEKKELKEKLKYAFGWLKGQVKDMVISTTPSVHRLSAPISELDIEKNAKLTMKAICNAFRVPSEVFGVETARYKIIEDGLRLLYTQCAAPDLDSVLAQWMQMVEGGNDFKLKADYSHLDFYKASQMQEGQAWATYAQAFQSLIETGICTVEEARIKLNLA